MWYSYRQNNTGGSFTGPALYIIVEAENADLADEIAEENGAYFDGCESGYDCPCCGDRWHRSYDEGDESPNVYGKPVEEEAQNEMYSWYPEEFALVVPFDAPSYLVKRPS